MGYYNRFNNDSLGNLFIMMMRMWINQPSTLQPLHKHNGKNVLVDCREEGKFVNMYFTQGDIISCRGPRVCLSHGWK